MRSCAARIAFRSTGRFIVWGALPDICGVNYGIVEETVKPANRRDAFRLFIAAFLRAVGMGMTAVLLALYLGNLGWSAGSVGTLIAFSFGGAAASTGLVSFLADHYGRRRTLII